MGTLLQFFQTAFQIDHIKKFKFLYWSKVTIANVFKWYRFSKLPLQFLQNYRYKFHSRIFYKHTKLSLGTIRKSILVIWHVMWGVLCTSINYTKRWWNVRTLVIRYLKQVLMLESKSKITCKIRTPPKEFSSVFPHDSGPNIVLYDSISLSFDFVLPITSSRKTFLLNTK